MSVREVDGAGRGHRSGAASAAEHESVDERFRSLMEGLRTTLPGVQVLFAFLLTAALQSRFEDLSGVEEAAFSVAFYGSGLASVLLIAPSIHQRVRAPMTGITRHSEAHLMWATWVAIVGSIAMGVAMAATVFFVSALVFTNRIAVVATCVIASILLWAWFYLPLVTFGRGGGREPDDG